MFAAIVVIVLIFAWTMLPQDGSSKVDSEDGEDHEDGPARSPGQPGVTRQRKKTSS